MRSRSYVESKWYVVRSCSSVIETEESLDLEFYGGAGLTLHDEPYVVREAEQR